MNYPYESIPVNWKRPPIDRAVMKACLERSDLKGALHGIGTLAILATTGSLAYTFFLQKLWLGMLLALTSTAPFMHSSPRHTN